MRSGHFWIWKFGTVPGRMNSVEKKFEFQDHKWEEYRGTRYYDGGLCARSWLARHPAKIEITGSSGGSSHHTKIFFFSKIMIFLDF